MEAARDGQAVLDVDGDPVAEEQSRLIEHVPRLDIPAGQVEDEE
jgi:hypothetical protein